MGTENNYSTDYNMGEEESEECSQLTLTLNKRLDKTVNDLLIVMLVL